MPQMAEDNTLYQYIRQLDNKVEFKNAIKKHLRLYMKSNSDSTYDHNTLGSCYQESKSLFHISYSIALYHSYNVTHDSVTQLL